MKTTIEVKDRKEGDAIKRAMDDPEIRAFVVISGVLLPFSRSTQQRVLDFVAGHFKEHDDE
jgi:O-methyltransferase involved in polyketide biosynthesis